MLRRDGFDPSIIQREDIVAKLNLVECLETRGPYQPHQRGGWQGKPYYERARSILQGPAIPPELKPFALTLFANTIYLSAAMLERLWQILCDEVIRMRCQML